ncbi:MAG: bifunctional hydroxymethylpyrimidine kinase/phosphomethylpyrimidine kinase [bacterium]|nr:bifunctional hydroxymethylpyrimidine kinase/phosphomethylpyrimidine kinase [bacterium]
MRPVVLAIAGSDSSAGAGVQADLKAIEANGAYAATAITAITAQNTRGVSSVTRLDPRVVREQIVAVLEDLPVRVVKTGMLGDRAIVAEVADALRGRSGLELVCDPVLLSKNGVALLDSAAVSVLLEDLLPQTTLITPNVHEISALSGVAVDGLPSAERAARELLARGANAVLVTGGHLPDAPCTDVLVTPERTLRIPGERVESVHTHGTGCTFASAIAARLALGSELEDAIRAAKVFVTEAIRHGLPLGDGCGPIDPFFATHAAVGEQR